MNFGEKVKKEIISKEIKDRVFEKSFICGYIRGSGTIISDNNSIELEIKASDENISNYIAEIIKDLYKTDVREISVSRDNLNKKDKFIISFFNQQAEKILLDLKIIKINNNNIILENEIDKIFIKDENNLKNFLRGLFLSNGSITVPENASEAKTGYHLQISFSHSLFASTVSDILLSYGINSKVTRNKMSYILYVKSAEDIKDFLALISTPISVLKLTDLMVNRDFINGINRQKNCDLGNVNRQLEAFYKQKTAIENIKEKNAFDVLNENLKNVALFRLSCPDDSIKELAQKLNISKECLNHRLRKIIEISENLKG